MPARPVKTTKGKSPEPAALPGPGAFRKGTYTLDAPALLGLKFIQEHAPEVRGDSAAIRYAVRLAVEKLTARKRRRS